MMCCYLNVHFQDQRVNYTNNCRVLVSFFTWAFDIHSYSLLSTQMLITVVTKAGDLPHFKRGLFLCVSMLLSLPWLANIMYHRW